MAVHPSPSHRSRLIGPRLLWLPVALLVAALLALASCDAVITEVERVEVSLPNSSLTVGQGAQAQAQVFASGGGGAANHSVQWTSERPGVATVNSNGWVTAVSPGETRIAASAGGSSGMVTVRVELPPEPPEITTTTLPDGTVDESYSATLEATGGEAPYSWSLASGTLPAGLTLSSVGVVSGTPTTAQSRTFTVRLTGANDLSSTRQLSLTVSAPPTSGGDLGVGFGEEQFSLIPAGTFQMGSENGRSNERPVHTVTLTRSFYMQRTPVTQGQWREIMGENPSWFSDCGDTCPVEQVSWNDAQAFIQALNQRYPGRNYRLPTEAEWEYAARAGTTGDYGGTGVLDDMGWYSGNSGGRTHPVALKQPNAFNLYDMHGNVWEWVQDWYSATYYSISPGVDPTGPTTGSDRVLRGGSWFVSASLARSAFRVSRAPSVRSNGGGFRLARTP